MEYFTGRFQGRIPITSSDAAERKVYMDAEAAEAIATLCNCIYGGDKWMISFVSKAKTKNWPTFILHFQTMTFTVYYYVVGKTYSSGDAPHQVEVGIEVDLSVSATDDVKFWPTLYTIVCSRVIDLLRQRRPHDQWVIVRMEQKNYLNL